MNWTSQVKVIEKIIENWIREICENTYSKLGDYGGNVFD